VKTLAFAFGLCIATVGAIGMLVPSLLVRIAQQFVAVGALAFLVLAAVRIAFGLLLVSVAAASLAPRALRIVGFAIATLGVITAITGLAGVAPAQNLIEGWLQRGSGIVRLTALPILLLGGFVSYACAPHERLLRSGSLLVVLAINGCTVAPPPPVTISERDLDAIRKSLANTPPASDSPADYHVSEVTVRDRAVLLGLAATTRGDGWQTTQRAACRRCSDDEHWSCLRLQPRTTASLPDGSQAVVIGLPGGVAAKAIRFVLARPSHVAELRSIPEAQLRDIACLTSTPDAKRIDVEYGGTTHHAGVEYGVLVLEKKGDSFLVESVTPAPNWFEGGSGSFSECEAGEVDVYPSC
jgi:hypothetical protein